jgi:hypothetical protein
MQSAVNIVYVFWKHFLPSGTVSCAKIGDVFHASRRIQFLHLKITGHCTISLTFVMPFNGSVSECYVLVYRKALNVIRFLQYRFCKTVGIK